MYELCSLFFIKYFKCYMLYGEMSEKKLLYIINLFVCLFFNLFIYVYIYILL